MRSERYISEKAHQVSNNLKRSLNAREFVTDYDAEMESDANDFRKIIERLKEKYHREDTDKTTKLHILSLFPPDWKAAKLAQTMETTRYLAEAGQKLFNEKGILSYPGVKLGKQLSESTKKTVLEYYVDQRNSAIQPGSKDFVMVRNADGQKTRVQKQLILSNLKELYIQFHLDYPDIKIGFSKFASMRPKHCILAGPRGTHTVCICPIHQNVKLMMLGCGLEEMSRNTLHPIITYQDCIDMILCPNASEKCYFRECQSCPGIGILESFIKELLFHNDIDEVRYKLWVSKPRTFLETFVKDSSEFIAEFCEKMEKLLPHSFVSKSQGNYMKKLKESLTEGEFLVITDFAENYAFVIQDAAPGFHWNNSQATVYPVVIYFQSGHKSMAIISDNLNHDVIAVHIYNGIAVNWIKTMSTSVKKIYYFSDGAPQQFKNFKNVVNLCKHKDDFGIDAEWHFFATAHGKGPCDGVGGTLKREAARASLQRPADRQITTPKELYEWASNPSNLPNILVEFSSKEDYERKVADMARRFEGVKKIKNLQKMHCIIPGIGGTVVAQRLSSSLNGKSFKILSE